MRDGARKLVLVGLSAFLAAAAFFGAMIVRSAFVEPPRPPPTELAPAELLNVGPNYQRVRGNVEINNLWVRSVRRWASETKTQIVKKVIPTGGATVAAFAYCKPDYQLIGCSGALDEDGIYSCVVKPDCGLTGVIPVDADGLRSTTNATGCKVVVDGDGPTEATVFAYCIQKGF